MSSSARFRFLASAIGAAVLALAGCSSNSTTATPPSSTPSAQGPVILYPATVSVPVGSQIDFAAYLQSQPTNATFAWTVSGTGAGTINGSTGVYTAPTSVPAPAQVIVTASAQGQKGTAVVTITSAQGLAISPAAVAIPASATVPFTAASNGQAVSATWQVTGPQQGANYGTIDASGNYTAPVAPPPGGVATITATSGALSGTATIQIQFSNATLKGQYTLAFSGADKSGDAFSVVGSFTADGAGNITSGLEDVSALTQNGSITPVQASPFTGSYTIGPDGRGSLSLSGAAAFSQSGADTLQVALVSSKHALFELSDSASGSNSFAGTGSGSIDQQNPVNFVQNAIANHYAVQLSGLDPSGNDIGIVGRLFASSGTIPASGSILDINDTAAQSPDDTDSAVSGSYTFDSAHPGSGRGTLSLTCPSCAFQYYYGSSSLIFTFYMVDSTHLKLVETDSTGAVVSGDAYSAPTPGAFVNVPAASYAFTVGGAELATQAQPYAIGGVIVFGSGGAISSGVFDENEAGTLSQNAAAITGEGTTFNGATGQILITLTTQTVQKSLVGYFVGSNAGVTSVLLLETDSKSFGTGAAFPQTVSATPQGTFALNLTGIANASLTEQDVNGTVSTAASGALSGAVDINNALVSNVASPNTLLVNSTLPVVGTHGRGTPLVLATTAPPANFHLSYYMIDANTVLLLETDGSRVMTGTMAKQF